MRQQAGIVFTGKWDPGIAAYSDVQGFASLQTRAGSARLDGFLLSLFDPGLWPFTWDPNHEVLISLHPARSSCHTLRFFTSYILRWLKLSILSFLQDGSRKFVRHNSIPAEPGVLASTIELPLEPQCSLGKRGLTHNTGLKEARAGFPFET